MHTHKEALVEDVNSVVWSVYGQDVQPVLPVALLYVPLNDIVA